MVDGRKDSLVSLLPRMERQFSDWDNHRWTTPSGKRIVLAVRRPRCYGGDDQWRTTEKTRVRSINSYMYGNAEAIAAAARLAGDNDAAQRYSCLADTLRTLIRTRLWDADARFL